MPNTLTPEAVRKVAELAKLQLTESDILRFSDQLGAVLDYIDVLNELDTAHVAPLYHPLELTDSLREDSVVPSLTRREALANAPKCDGEYFLVPQILTGK